MTDARLSQLAVEVIRTNLAAGAQLSQLAVEVIRPNVGRGLTAAIGAFTLTGKTSRGLKGYAVLPDAGTFSLSGKDAGSLRHYIMPVDKGTYVFTGINAEFARPSSILGSPGDYTLTGRSATLAFKHKLPAGYTTYTMTGQAATFAYIRTLVAAPATYLYLVSPTMPGLGGNPGSFTLTGVNATLKIAPSAVVEEIVNFSESTPAGWNLATTATDLLNVQEVLRVALGIVTAEGVTTSEAFNASFYPTAIVRESIVYRETTTAVMSFSTTIIDSTKLADQLQSAFPVELADTIIAQDVADGVIGLLILDSLIAGESILGETSYGMELLDAIYSADSLARFLDGTINETWAVAETVTPTWRLPKIITDALGIVDDAAGKLMIRVTATDESIFADTTPANWIFAPTITDNIDITIGYVSPDGSFTTWAVNTRTGAVTEYSNYTFNSFCQAGHKYLGSSTSGLYELNGDDDAGDDVIAHVKSGYAQFGGSKYSSFKAAYLGMRGNGDIILKLDTGDGNSYTYQTVIQDMQSTKVRLGKGLRARYFAFELISTGTDFDLDTIEFIPLVAQRRV